MITIETVHGAGGTFEQAAIAICNHCRLFLSNGPEHDTPEDIAESIGARWSYTEGRSVHASGARWDDDYEEHSRYPCQSCGDSAHGERYGATVMRKIEDE